MAERCNDLWFEDGTVVIQAESTQYRLSRGILAKHSPVFRDMFSLPQSDISQPLVEGCAVVHFHDTESDMTMFLRAIFEPTYFLPFPSPTEFDIIIACLSLAHKYDVAFLRSRALSHIACRYGFLQLSVADKTILPRVRADLFSWPLPQDARFRLRLVRRIREVGATWCLPVLFYSISLRLDAAPELLLEPASLSAEDRVTILKGRAATALCGGVDMLACLSEPVADQAQCGRSRVQCTEKRLAYLHKYRARTRAMMYHPLGMMHEMKSFDTQGFCPSCSQQLEKARDNARQAFWDRLPAMYGLPPWDELERLMVDDVGKDPFSVR